MKKALLTVAIVMIMIGAAALVFTGVVNAQSPTGQGAAVGTSSGTGMMYGRGQRGNMQNAATPGTNGAAAGSQTGLLHDDLIAIYAEELGIPVDTLNTRLANGETLAQIAFAQGFTFEELRTMMVDARTQAIDQALADGELTEAQATWMKQHGAGQMSQSMGAGRGMRGAGQGQYANPDCPYFEANP
jgi:hypothetical protein